MQLRYPTVSSLNIRVKFIEDIALIIYDLFHEKTSASGIKNGNMSDQCPTDLARVAKVFVRMRQLAE